MNTGLHISECRIEEVTFSYNNLYREGMKDLRKLQDNDYKLHSLDVVASILGMPIYDGIETVEDYINQFTKTVNDKLGLKLFWLAVAGRDKEAAEIEEFTAKYLNDVRRIVLG